MDHIYFDHALRYWIIAAVTLKLVFLLLSFLLKSITAKLDRLSSSTSTLFDDFIVSILHSTKFVFLFAVAFDLASYVLDLKPATRILISKGFILACLFQGLLWGNTSLDFWIERYLEKKSLKDASIATSLGLIGFVARFTFYTLIVLLALHNLGFDITTLIAGLGVGGVAVALSLQNILGDLFASLSIVLDKPFVVGDFIVVGDFMGSIEHIGLKTTRIRSLSGEQLIFSNGDLLKSRVRNFKRMAERRVVTQLSVVYETSHAKLTAIPTLVKAVVESTEKARFDRCHFLKFGSSSLDFELVYWVSDADFNVYADAAQKINLEIVRRFREAAIDFAFSTQTLFVKPLDEISRKSDGTRDSVNRTTAVIN